METTIICRGSRGGSGLLHVFEQPLQTLFVFCRQHQSSKLFKCWWTMSPCSRAALAGLSSFPASHQRQTVMAHRSNCKIWLASGWSQSSRHSASPRSWTPALQQSNDRRGRHDLYVAAGTRCTDSRQRRREGSEAATSARALAAYVGNRRLFCSRSLA